MYTYYLSLGTNLGDKEGNLRQAIQLIEERIGAIASSPLFMFPNLGVSNRKIVF